ncbi:MAG: endoribonuclease YicC domain-containing protein, partial [Bacteroidota bacterium]
LVFLLQPVDKGTIEIGREVNTLGSKSNHTEMQKIVVMMKDELEQIKEQVLNVL